MLSSALEQHIRRNLPLEAKDHLGVVSRMWAVTDEHLIDGGWRMAELPVFIAGAIIGTRRAYVVSRRSQGGWAGAERRNSGQLHDDDMLCRWPIRAINLADASTHQRLPRAHRRAAATSSVAALEVERASSATDAWETVVLDGTQACWRFERSRRRLANGEIYRPGPRWPSWQPNTSEIGRTGSRLAALPFEEAVAGRSRRLGCFKYVHLLRESRRLPIRMTWLRWHRRPQWPKSKRSRSLQEKNAAQIHLLLPKIAYGTFNSLRTDDPTGCCAHTNLSHI